jgi:hypothetical protein
MLLDDHFIVKIRKVKDSDKSILSVTNLVTYVVFMQLPLLPFYLKGVVFDEILNIVWVVWWLLVVCISYLAWSSGLLSFLFVGGLFLLFILAPLFRMLKYYFEPNAGWSVSVEWWFYNWCLFFIPPLLFVLFMLFLLTIDSPEQESKEGKNQ